MPLFSRGTCSLSDSGCLQPRALLCRILGAYFLCAALFLGIARANGFAPVGDDWAACTAAISLPLLCGCTGLVFGLLTVVRLLCRHPLSDSLALFAGFLLLACTALWQNENPALAAGSTLLLFLLSLALVRTEDFAPLRHLPPETIRTLLVALPLLTAALVALLCVYQYRSYHNSCFDLGIFSQMFHSMKTDLTQVTTCERNRPLSHFGIHASPIYYLLLPVYLLAPVTETLLVSQAVLVVSGVIPLLLLARTRKLGDLSLLAVCVIYCTNAALISPCFYDFHENAFLPPLLLWFLYAAETRRYPLACVFGVLTLCVKEDAPLYLLCIGLCYLCTKGKRLFGGITCGAAVICFVAVTALLGRHGEGTMAYRTYAGLMPSPDSGISAVITTVLQNPVRFLAVCFSAEKLPFLLSMLLPLLFLPLSPRQPQRLFLALPFLLTNLAASYVYASDIHYQYVFGTGACLLAAAVLNGAELPARIRHAVLPLMAAASLLQCLSTDSPMLSHYYHYRDNRATYKEIADALNAIPTDASVCADTWLLPHLTNRRTLYLLDDCQAPPFYDCTYVVLQTSDTYTRIRTEQLRAIGYRQLPDVTDEIAIFQKPK